MRPIDFYWTDPTSFDMAATLFSILNRSEPVVILEKLETYPLVSPHYVTRVFAHPWYKSHTYAYISGL